MPKEDGGATPKPFAEGTTHGIWLGTNAWISMSNSPIDLAQVINTAHAAAVAEAVREAYERAAKVAQGVEGEAGDSIAAAIRALSKGGGE